MTTAERTKQYLAKMKPVERHEMPLDEWLLNQAIKLGYTFRYIEKLYYTGQLPPIKTRRVNKRVIFVILN